MDFLDYTDKSPASYRVRMRKPEELTTIVCHQMGVGVWREDNPMFAKTRAHFVAQQSGRVIKNHDPLWRLRYGSGVINHCCITLECAGNYETSRGVWWKPESMGRSKLADHPKQVASARELVAQLCEDYPSITTITGHRAISRGKSGCPGPDLYREIVMWGVRELGLDEGPTLKGGAVIPDSWRAQSSG